MHIIQVVLLVAWALEVAQKVAWVHLMQVVEWQVHGS